jgi:hypothetical protein
LTSAYCNITASSLNQAIHAISISGATSYRFRFTSGGVSQIYTSPTYYMYLSNLSLNLATTYVVDIAVEIGGTFGPYGNTCNLITPNAITTQLTNTYCNITASSLDQVIHAISRPGATAYRFRFTSGGVSQVYTSTAYYMYLSNLTLNLGTTYSVDVAVEIGGTFGPYGNTCNIITPNAITTQLTNTYCNSTTSSLNQAIHAISRTGATAYRFRFTSGGVSQIYTSPTYFMYLSNLSLNLATTYSVDVAVEIGGTFGPYGSICNITTPSTPSTITMNNKSTITANDKTLNQVSFLFEAKMYPNPFTDVIRMNVSSDDMESLVSISVYDATGRLVENQTMNLTQQAELQLGENYQPGVYHVNITQNEYTETKRIVKN